MIHWSIEYSTVTFLVAVTEPSLVEAVIVAVPLVFATIVPSSETSTTFGLEDFQTISAVYAASSGKTFA